MADDAGSTGDAGSADGEEPSDSGRPADDGSVPNPEVGHAAATTVDGADSSTEETPGAVGSPGRREVVVPQELFRIVVVFSTVLAVLAIILGFTLFDAATRVVENPTGSVFVDVVRFLFGLSLAAVEPHLATIALGVGLLGVGCVGLGVWIYAIGTRFRTEMRTHKNAADEGTDDG